MREILFRGKRVDNGKWVYGNLINWHPKLNPRIIWFDDCEIDEFKETNNEVLKESVGQFTGLLDKNDKKIFEGDVLKARTQHVVHPSDVFKFKEEFLTSAIYWDSNYCCFETDFNGCLLSESNEIFEIIGNIHEN